MLNKMARRHRGRGKNQTRSRGHRASMMDKRLIFITKTIPTPTQRAHAHMHRYDLSGLRIQPTKIVTSEFRNCGTGIKLNIMTSLELPNRHRRGGGGTMGVSWIREEEKKIKFVLNLSLSSTNKNRCWAEEGSSATGRYQQTEATGDGKNYEH